MSEMQRMAMPFSLNAIEFEFPEGLTVSYADPANLENPLVIEFSVLKVRLGGDEEVDIAAAELIDAANQLIVVLRDKQRGVPETRPSRRHMP